MLDKVPPGVATWTWPVEAPSGTVVVMSEADVTVNDAAMPLKVTLVVPIRLVPRILTARPTFPEVGSVFTNEPSPETSWKTVPTPSAPPKLVVP